MASYKDTFEPKTFAANTFACGTWRGRSTVVVVPGAEYAFGYDRSHYEASTERSHFAFAKIRAHFDMPPDRS